MATAIPNTKPIPPPPNLPFLSAHVIPPSSLPPDSSLFPSLLSLLNRSFSASHHTSTRSSLPPDYPRIPTAEHFLADVGQAGFVILLRGEKPDPPSVGTKSSDDVTDEEARPGEPPEIGGLTGAGANALNAPAPKDPPDPFPFVDLGPDTVVGTISAVPHDPIAQKRKPKREDERFTMFLTYPDVPIRDDDAGVEIRTWMLKLMAVDLRFQRQGVADYLLESVLAEIWRREREEPVVRLREDGGADDGVVGKGGYRIRLLFSTIKEINFSFYTKKGYRWVQDIPVEKGVLGSRDGFTVVWLERVFEM